MTTRYNYIHFLSEFWSKYYEDADILDAALSAHTTNIKDSYFSFLQRALPANIANYPIFKEKFWNTIEIIFEESRTLDQYGNVTDIPSLVEFIEYPLDEPYAHIPFLYNTVFDPSKIYKGSKDIKELTENVESGDLIINQKYLNQSEYELTTNSQIIGPYKTFFAISKNYTRAGGAGKVVKAFDYIIKRIEIKNETNLSKKIKSSVLFKVDSDPYYSPDVAKRKTENSKTSMILFAPKAFIDDQELFKIFGDIIGVYSISSTEYRNLLDGLRQLYLKGPSIAVMNAALNLSSGYPAARTNEEIIKVEVQKFKFILYSNQNNIYELPRKEVSEVIINNVGEMELKKRALPRLKFDSEIVNSASGVIQNKCFYLPDLTDDKWEYKTFNVSWKVRKLDTFIDDLKIVDYINEDKWWQKKINSKLLSDIIEIDHTKRSDPFIINYLFERYLKYNTFGVFIDLRVLGEFNVLKDFFKIISDTKPRQKRFLISESDIRVYSEVNLQNVDATKVNIIPYFLVEDIIDMIPVVGMNLIGLPNGSIDEMDVITLGMPLEDIGFNYDIVNKKILIRALLDDNNNPLPGTIFSNVNIINDIEEYTLGQEDAYLGMIPFEGLSDRINVNLRDLNSDLETCLFFITFYINTILDFSGNNNKLLSKDPEYITSYRPNFKAIVLNNKCIDSDFTNDINFKDSFYFAFNIKFNNLVNKKALFRFYHNDNLDNSRLNVYTYNNKLRIELFDSVLNSSLLYESSSIFNTTNYGHTFFMFNSDTKTATLRYNFQSVTLNLINENNNITDINNFTSLRATEESLNIGQSGDSQTQNGNFILNDFVFGLGIVDNTYITKLETHSGL